MTKLFCRKGKVYIFRQAGFYFTTLLKHICNFSKMKPATRSLYLGVCSLKPALRSMHPEACSLLLSIHPGTGILYRRIPELIEHHFGIRY